MKPFIIVDVGSNHRGSLDLALKHIDAAKACGADAVKYQLFSHEDLYGFPGTVAGSIDICWLSHLSDYARLRNIEFMCTAFSAEGVRTVDKYVSRHKIASAEMKDTEILDAVAATGKPFIVSTGGAHFSEVEWLIQTYDPTAILECVALYPAEPRHYNLNALTVMTQLSSITKAPKGGISDHTIGDVVAVAAVGFGATIFEKHFDCEKDSCLLGPTPDSPVSIGPAAMAHYVRSIHTAMSAVGDGVKRPAHQHEMALKWRRRLIATVDLEPGDTLQRGVNFGSYRSLKNDTRAAGSERIGEFDGRVMKATVKAGDGIWETDIE